MQFVPYQDTPSPPMTPELRAACKRAAHVITTEGRTLRAGRAALFVLRCCGWRRTGRVLSWPPMVWFVELGYWIVARNRVFFSRFMFKKKPETPPT